jgi:hypothetical protein
LLTWESISNFNFNNISLPIGVENYAFRITFGISNPNCNKKQENVNAWINLESWGSDPYYKDNFVNSLVTSNVKEFTLYLDLPLTNPFTETKQCVGLTKFEIYDWIAESYNRIYSEEDSSKTEQKESTSILNRGKSNGVYGIYGWSFEDLDLSTVRVNLATGEIKVLIDT